MSDSAIDVLTVSRSVSCAAGVYAPGHLGELTQHVPFELVDDLLEQTRTVQQRLRDLPSRVGVYFVLALALFPSLGYARVWDRLTAGLDGLAVSSPSEKALRDLRRRLGPAPLKALFEVLAGSLARPSTPGVRYRGLRTVAFDGCASLKVPDTDRNRSWLGRIRYRMGFAGYPTIRLMTLVETGTRGLLGAALGSRSDRDEVGIARRLLPLLAPGMLVLMDRGFDATEFLGQVTGTGAQFLVRAKSTRTPPVLAHLADGSYRSDLAGLPVRIIEADLAVTGADGSLVQDRYRLITSLLDHRRYPATELVRLYHERWEIELAYLALRHTILQGHVLRSHDRAGLEQEVWALLTVHQLLRIVMVEAVESRPGLDPDRASFTIALSTARDQVIAAAGILFDDRRDPPDLLGTIGRDVLAGLLPARRARYSARKVKNATARYLGRDTTRPQYTTSITSIEVSLYLPPVTGPRKRPTPAPRPDGPTRREKVTAIMAADPARNWHGGDLAERLGIKTRNMLTQLGEWTRLGFLTRTGQGTYALPGPP